MYRDSIIKLYFSLGMHYGDILSALASQGIVISQSTLTQSSLVLSMLCAGFKYFVCTFYYFIRTFTKLCTRFSKTSSWTKKTKYDFTTPRLHTLFVQIKQIRNNVLIPKL